MMTENGKHKLLKAAALLSGLFCTVFCTLPSPGPEAESGVSRELALSRAAAIDSLSYELSFILNPDRDKKIVGSETVEFIYRKDDISNLLLDFKSDDNSPITVSVNGKMIPARLRNEHLIIPFHELAEGRNTLEIRFIAGDLPLNRREGYMYTLLVPDRARELFPCFDQPDLKASYKLSLVVPIGWTAVSTSPIASRDSLESASAVRLNFAPTEPISSYLFSFTAGDFQTMSAERDGRRITMYHRESDSLHLAQGPEIFTRVFDALNYMEEYTGIPYPFSKYDFVALPDFQFGGMEHSGATYYNASRIFLPKDPTSSQVIARDQLIAHETAHMWFGDYVTMRWFDDVWTKEVFANWFASRICAAQDTSKALSATGSETSRLSDLRTLYQASYSEDRTAGANPIRRPLENLSDAGLIYCNIIYDKAPIVMDKLVDRMGEEAFRKGLQDYLSAHPYGNADWDELISALKPHCDFDIQRWSREWVYGTGMPVYHCSIDVNKLTVRQEDSSSVDQSVNYRVYGKNGQKSDVVLSFKDGARQAEMMIPFVISHAVPNIDGRAYGSFVLDEITAAQIRDSWMDHTPVSRMSLLMTLYDNVWRRRISARSFLQWASFAILDERNPLIFESLAEFATEALLMLDEGDKISSTNSLCLEQSLMGIVSDYEFPAQLRLIALRKLSYIAMLNSTNSFLLKLFTGEWKLEGLDLSEKDRTNLCYQLMLRLPEKYGDLRKLERSRISDPERLANFNFISQACHPSSYQKERFFSSLKKVENRRPESRVLQALALLHHPLQQNSSVAYLRPSLELLEEIQATGDIFFPASWCKTILGSYHNRDAAYIVRSYLSDNPDLNPLLKTKILQGAGYLMQFPTLELVVPISF